VERLDAVLAEHPFFRGLKDEYLDLIAGCAANVHIEAGQTLFAEGDPADRFWAVRHGSVSVEIHAPDRGSLVVQTLGPGEILGWSWLFPPHIWKFDARAREAVRATVFDGACLRDKCDADPALGYELMKRLARVVTHQLEMTRLQLLDLYGAKPRA